MTILVEQLSLGGNGPVVVVKDTIDAAGTPARASSYALEGVESATEHASVVQAMLDKGCQLIGKTKLHELAYGTTGISWKGMASNPRFPILIPGGSSSGSAAAVATGLADFALGTDTDGSIRIPACCCGVFSLKSTFGRVSRKGVMPERSSRDCVGPITNSLPMLVTAMQSIDLSSSELPCLSDVLIGVLQVDASDAVRRVVDGALAGSCLPLDPVLLSHMADAYDAGMVVINRESFNACGHLLATGRVGDDIASRLRSAGETSDQALADAESVRVRFATEVDDALERFDVLALPTMPNFPLRIEDATDTLAVLGMTSLVRPFNLSGHPPLTIPLGIAEGLPVGLQLVASKGADEHLLAVAGLLLQRLYSSQIGTWNQ